MQNSKHFRVFFTAKQHYTFFVQTLKTPYKCMLGRRDIVLYSFIDKQTLLVVDVITLMTNATIKI